MRYRRNTNGALVGIAVVLIGVLLLVNSTGVWDASQLLRFAPSLFVLIGVWAFVASGFRNVFGPLLLVAGASAAQAVTLGVATWDQVVLFWPLAVVFLGVSLALGAYQAGRGVPASDEQFLNAIAVFGGVDKRATSSTFRGAQAFALFGGATLDIRDTTPVDAATPIRVNATALFGAVEIIAPRDWNVRFDVLPVLGAAEDSRLREERTHEQVDLVVSGFTAFGAIEVKD